AGPTAVRPALTPRRSRSLAPRPSPGAYFAPEGASPSREDHEAIRPAYRYNRIRVPPPVRLVPTRVLRHPDGEPTIMPPTRDPAPDLLVGLLALQTGLINQAQLVAAFHAWTQAKGRPMAEILAEQGALEAPCLALVEGLVIEHRRRHGSDPERSLAA